jgi:hypothetical protein
MELRQSLFWDNPINENEYGIYWKEVIVRVVERGTFDEWKKIKAYFGLEKIKEAVVTSSYLDKYTLSFFSNYFDIPEQDFQCFTTKQYNQELWEF